MLISIYDMQNRFKVSPIRVLHCGAHEAEELEIYERTNFSPKGVVWVEANPKLVDKLRTKFDNSSHKVINAALWSESNAELQFHLTSNSQSSSLLELGNHIDHFPDIIEVGTFTVLTKRIDSFRDDLAGVDFINLDIQGAELEALKGAGKILEQIKWVYTEVNKSEVYKGCAKVWELDAFLSEKGFKRIATRWSHGEDWGDALYARSYPIFQSCLFALWGFRDTSVTRVRYFLHSIKLSLRRKRI
jgi:FkbM family methyltransferase